MSLVTEVAKAIKEWDGQVTGNEQFPTSYKNLEKMYQKNMEYYRKFNVGDFIVRVGNTYRTGKAAIVAKHESGAIYIKEILESGHLASRLMILNLTCDWQPDPDYATSKLLGEKFDPDAKQRAERNRQARFRKKQKEALILKVEDGSKITREMLESLMKRTDLYVPDFALHRSWYNHIMAKDIKEWVKISIKKEEKADPYSEGKEKVDVYSFCGPDGKSFESITINKGDTTTWGTRIRHILTNKPVEVL